MHVLLTNDDGPLDDATCPYMKYLVDAILTQTSWDLSIIVPDQQRSWIGKAHFAGKTLTTSYIYTKILTETKNNAINAFEGPFPSPQEKFQSLPQYQEWTLLDSTPAACADVGIHHLYGQKGPIDLVISGPNFGKNSSNLYILASGTVGAAMEAVTHGVKAIALSYAFNNLDHDFDTLKEAAKISVKLIAKLYPDLKDNEDVDLYSVNVPLIPSLKAGKTRIHYAPILLNYWNSIYTPMLEKNEGGQTQFAWTPDFKKVYKDGLEDTEHTDSRVLLDEGVSVTPLKATFKIANPLSGEIYLDNDDEINEKEVIAEQTSQKHDFALITFPKSSYIYRPLIEALLKYFTIVTDPKIAYETVGSRSNKVVHFGEYEDLNLDLITSDSANYFVCSYIYRKGLIRKHYLSNTIRYYVAKNPDSLLKTRFPDTYTLEVDYAEFLDDALDDAYELRDEIENGTKTWILKPSMSDKGQGIRLFQTIDQLQAIFDSFEGNDSDGEDEGEAEDDDKNGIIISQLRHFVVQEYQTNPLLLSAYDNKKFHLRVYVVCQGDLKVYVYRNILALFADTPFQLPSASDHSEIESDVIDLAGHLTNTCLQELEAPLVVPFWELNGLSRTQQETVFQQVCTVVGELFEAATSVDKMNFQPMQNALEIYGIDFLVDATGRPTLLEVNAYPDFKQTGDELKPLIATLFESVATKVVEPLVHGLKESNTSSLLVKVLDH
ncbi:uncharacterized protein KQ657_000379 [Scheffersomyces spartinae]|uniref:Survival protein SurE-like phosphatase/nucleotidase domain-containing protein n=1 Tax=Scheffersomyces spartinae TaxID=45513 RepID=A0A9P8AHT0_9ASCO|nr:uncharacterized protein KQ657_000379 [Scheffersomyces spartinae]KAG7193692.1 hypothetical protein KQ657_000379 [Scheffersomyces spartinae]